MVFTPFMLKDTVWNYVEKTSGRAKIIVRRINDTVYITGSCDSLYHLLVSKETQTSNNHTQASVAKTVDKSSSKNRTAILIVAIESIILILFIVLWILNKIYNPFKK